MRSCEARRRRVRLRDPLCTARLPDGTVCGRPTTEAHHWYSHAAGDLRERDEHMQGVCSDCHSAAHRWPGRFPPGLAADRPFRLDLSDWPRRP